MIRAGPRRCRSFDLRARHQAAARRFGATKSNLRRKGITKTDFDLAIAAIALEIGATVVSKDRAFHDGSIPGLATENWLQATS